MVKVKWVWRILTTWYDPKRNQWLSTWWHLLKLRCSLYTSQDIEDVVVVGYSNNKMKVMTISFLWVSLEQWGVQNGIVSLIYLEQPRLDFPVFQLGLYCPWKWEKVNDLNNLLDYDINSPGDQDTQGHGRIIPSTLKCRLTWFLMFHDFQWRHLYPQAVLNLRCGERLSPPHPLFSVQPPPSRYSNVTRSSKSQVMFISICFINSATHIFPPQEIIVSVAITRYLLLRLRSNRPWQRAQLIRGNSFLTLGKVFLS